MLVAHRGVGLAAHAPKSAKTATERVRWGGHAVFRLISEAHRETDVEDADSQAWALAAGQLDRTGDREARSG